MKKVLVVIAIFIAMVLMVGCGGGGNSSGSESNNQECTSGDFKCIGSESYYCNSLGSWVYDARCENGCDSSTGRCYSDSGDFSDSGNNNDQGDSSGSGNGSDNTDSGDSSANCTDEGSFRCYNDKIRQKCVSGTWVNFEECEYVCNSTTQQCEDEHGCKSGEYKCIGNNSHYCNNDFWELNEKCQYDCDYSTGKCKDSECTTGEYLCGESTESEYQYASYYCENGSWQYDKTCSGECEKSTGLCEATCVLIDTHTLKQWSEAAISAMTWEEAKEYCENLTECGYSDWTLPNIRELRTLIQHCDDTSLYRVDETINSSYQCGVDLSCLSPQCSNEYCDGCTELHIEYSKLGDNGLFWSSSTYEDKAWGVLFLTATVVIIDKRSDIAVRCIRDEY